MKAKDVYTQMDGDLTKRYYREIAARGGIAGVVAVNLFRAQKCSARAKTYKRHSHKSEAYGRKEWSMQNLCEVLGKHSHALSIRYGWRQDDSVVFGNEPSFVLYVELPNGQVSFHCPRRGEGPDYERKWDGAKASSERIIEFCDMVWNREWPTFTEAWN